MRVLAAIDKADGKTITERIRHVSELSFEDEEGNRRRFTFRTIETWRLRYKKHGFTAISRDPRSDKGKTRKVSPEQVQEAVEQARPFFRSNDFKLSELYRTCIERGFLRRDQIAANTFRRIIKQYDIMTPDKDTKSKKRLAFAKQYANECWQADTLFGPHITVGNITKQTKLIAFVDDASRLCCHGQFFTEENSINFKIAFKQAIYKRGLPQMLYVDNGCIYSTAELTCIAARLGCRLCHTPVRDGAAKGKVERFFRTCRDQFLSRQLDLSSIDTLNDQFIQWVEDQYNHHKHSTLGMTPVERYALDVNRIQYLPPTPYLDELFMLEDTRSVRADNTFPFKAQRYQAPADLRNKQITIRFNQIPKGKQTILKAIPVYYKTQRIGEAKLVDLYKNDRKPKA